MTEIVLQYKGRDSWSRPVYEDASGKLWKDVDPRANIAPNLCSAYNNEFEGEPDVPMEVMECYQDVKIVFEPKRNTW